ncbi:MAG TPA: UDP-N-acetylmuramoyl-tripeptide--D-alanyl-D-alanine ligase [Candidatus Paceibacterota bacterium]|nr:UDP-N-acetylmuramoyl-tripeptide--D-alanyl-D-alanine ligase [Candidatus Paceibacterota bacterium]
MREFFRNLLAAILATLARAVLRKYKPKVIMVTGSVGKTSTKDAITAVLDRNFYLRSSKKNFNSEFGVPLTIFGMADKWSGLKDWPPIIIEAFALLLFPNHYPKVLVLEVGADRPGDLARILKIATPDIVVVTRLPEMPVHVEAYATPAAVREEEFAPAYALAPGAPLIVSADDQYARALAAPLSVHLMTYGVSEDADVRILSDGPLMETIDGQQWLAGMEGTLLVHGREYTVPVRGAVGRPQLLAPTAAVATGLCMGMTLKHILAGAATYEPPAGRGRLLHGKHGSLIMDDSYNASPAAVREALASMQIAHAVMPGSRRIAVLGDMLELGRYSREEHERIGTDAAKKCDVLIAVGIRSREMAEAAKTAGMQEDAVHTFDTAQEAGSFLRDFIQANDIILIKGSQSMRMERVGEAILQNPSDQKNLVRQDAIWKRA